MVKLYAAYKYNKDKLEEIPIEISNFPDNSLHLKINFKPDLNPDGMIIDWRYEGDSELFLVAAIKDKVNNDWFDLPIALNLFYFPNARMDRVKRDEDCFTLKTFCNILNSFEFDIINTIDVHSNVAIALTNNLIVKNVENYIGKAIAEIGAENLVIFYPDEGAMKRYSDKLKYPYAFGIKDRDWETGEIKNLTIINKELIKDKKILIIDDICSRGGTFLHAANALKAAGADTIYLWATHTERTMLEGEMYNAPDLIEHIYSTDSLPQYTLENKTTYYEII